MTATDPNAKKLSEWNMQMWMGQICYEDAKYLEGSRKFKKALSILDELNIRDQRRATNLNNLALCYCAQGKHDKADLLYEEAFRIDENSAHVDKDALAVDLENMATHYRRQGMFDRSEQLYRRALDILDKEEKTNALELASCLNNMGILYCGQKKCHEAEPFFRKAVTLRATKLGRRSKEYAESLIGLAANLCMQGNCEEAEPMFEEGIRVLGYKVGPHPELADALELYVEHLRMIGKKADANGVKKRINSIRKKKY